MSKRFAELFAAARAEFGDAALSASDHALLEQACGLMARRMRDEENSIKATNAARRLHKRYGHTPASPPSPPPWSPLRSRLNAAAGAPSPAAVSEPEAAA